MANKFADLTDDAKLKAEYQKLDELLASEENMEKFSRMTTPEEVFAFFEENGYTYTDEMKAEIIKFADQQSSDAELSEDDLAEVSGGWSWLGGGCGSVIGGLGGTAAGVAVTLSVCTGPIGWIIGGCAAAGAVVVGAAIGMTS